jgi:hypothetical protein
MTLHFGQYALNALQQREEGYEFDEFDEFTYIYTPLNITLSAVLPATDKA